MMWCGLVRCRIAMRGRYRNFFVLLLLSRRILVLWVLESILIVLLHSRLICAHLRLHSVRNGVFLDILVLEVLILHMQPLLFLFLLMLSVYMFSSGSSSFKHHMGSNILSALACDLAGDHISTRSSKTKCQPADDSTNGHRGNDVSLPGVVRGSPQFQTGLNDVPLLPRIVDAGCCQTEADEGYARCEGREQDGRRGGSCSSSYLAGVIIPFLVELLRAHAIALLVVFVVVERHGASTGAASNDRRKMKTDLVVGETDRDDSSHPNEQRRHDGRDSNNNSKKVNRKSDNERKRGRCTEQATYHTTTTNIKRAAARKAYSSEGGSLLPTAEKASAFGCWAVSETPRRIRLGDLWLSRS